MTMTIKDIFNIINIKAGEKAKNWDFKTEEEYRTYIYEHELPFVEAKEKVWWSYEDGKYVYYWHDGKKY